MRQITQNVFVETGFSRGCNPGFITTSEGIVMVDSPYRPSDAIRWREEIARRGKVLYLINTESHRDHITGNAFFDVPVIAHQGIRAEFLNLGGDAADRRGHRSRGSVPAGGLPAQPSPIDLHRPADPLHLGEQTLEILCLPGHTLYQTAVYLPHERVVFTGDNVCNAGQPFLHQAKPKQWLRSLDQIGQLEADHVVPGHGEVGDKGTLPSMRDYLAEFMAEVQKAIDAGLPRAEVVERICQTAKLWQRALPPGVEAVFAMFKRVMAERIYEELTVS